ncbi:LutC/YkgG family protein [Sphingobacterium griseoflavum]|uniref:LUD domain-containing protein n=1 Tax=Sphingobacterium griseoflavum TaxID=1474952 RepID=A0ABQ3HX02_9SPHI|nr:LUD domain-containing protein [Sphingobacterium griseoflavum]GHE40120.1 hypothetical protein GCM10017764_24120 [Sphingobacterium griseoflavum]
MNIRNTTAKERMLKKIRQALLQKRDNPYLDFEDSPLYKDEEEALDVTFARELTEVGGHFVYCDGEISVIENLILLAETLEVTKIFAWEPSIQKLLDQYGFPVYTGAHHFSEAEMSITSCESLVARSGSVLIANAEGGGRKLAAYPPIHVVIAKASQLVMDVKHSLRRIQEKYSGVHPSMLRLVTGPSRSKAVENEMVIGSHGSKALYVFLLEDRF